MHNTKRDIKKRVRKGMTLVELLGVMVVIAILSAIAVGGISAARDNANITSVISDMRTYENSLKQVLMLHPEVMKFTADKPANAADRIVGFINEQMEEQWSFNRFTDNQGSGAVATSAIKRDAWGNAYCLYLFFDDTATSYHDKSGTLLRDSDSCMYIVIASPGKNSTGAGLGVDGDNFDAGTKRLLSAAKCVNNTDGIDDLGIIVRVLNGDVYSATFGTDKSTLGKLENIQWIYGIPANDAATNSNGGIIHNYKDTDSSTVVTGTQYAGSIDLFYDLSRIDGAIPGKDCWVGGQDAKGYSGFSGSPGSIENPGGDGDDKS